MTRARASIALMGALLALLGCVPVAGAATTFRPRIGGAMGLLPLRNALASRPPPLIPLVYHGGTVMRGVTLHTIFWAPSGFRFSGPPAAGVPSYAGLVQQFAADVASASGSADNVFSLIPQYPDRGAATRYGITYDPGRDSILDTNPYPGGGHTCDSPSGVATCVSDRELQLELLRVIRSHDPSAVGLHDLWLVLLPPDVDTCVSLGACATNAYAGYHSVVNSGGSPVVYSAIPDPQVELTPPKGSDPQGNPEAESTLNTIAHEVVEAISDPVGTGWMDPNGFEIGDKCQTGPQYGTPLGHASDGAPYNQVIGGHQYLLQTMWSNQDSGCRQSSAVSAPPPVLPQVSLTQYSSVVSGSSGVARATSVAVILARGGTPVGLGSGQTDSSGRWQVTLRSTAGTSVAVGDDRDELVVRYGQGPAPELIQTGDGGNPFTAAGWTGWFDLDHGFAIGSRSVLIAPCSQVGRLTLTVDGASTDSPELACSTEDDSARIQVPPIAPSARLSLSSEDNRAATATTPYGALVKLSVMLGEPGALGSTPNHLIPFDPGGQAACTADLRRQQVRCDGLVPDGRYVLMRRRGGAALSARADGSGTASFSRFAGRQGSPAISGGDVLSLLNHSTQVLTSLHVAHLRVDLGGASTIARSGHCEPGEYLGAPVSGPPIGVGIGRPGVAGAGLVCPATGNAAGLSTADLAQLDDRSGGQTVTEVPLIEGTAPVQNETLYGQFRVLAQAGFASSDGSIRAAHDPISVQIVRSGSRRVLFRARNVDTPAGVEVRGLAPGSYTAIWVLHDAAGDTRTLRTQFVQERRYPPAPRSTAKTPVRPGSAGSAP